MGAWRSYLLRHILKKKKKTLGTLLYDIPARALSFSFGHYCVVLQTREPPQTGTPGSEIQVFVVRAVKAGGRQKQNLVQMLVVLCQAGKQR